MAADAAVVLALAFAVYTYRAAQRAQLRDNDRRLLIEARRVLVRLARDYADDPPPRGVKAAINLTQRKLRFDTVLELEHIAMQIRLKKHKEMATTIWAFANSAAAGMQITETDFRELQTELATAAKSAILRPGLIDRFRGAVSKHR